MDKKHRLDLSGKCTIMTIALAVAAGFSIRGGASRPGKDVWTILLELPTSVRESFLSAALAGRDASVSITARKRG